MHTSVRELPQREAQWRYSLKHRTRGYELQNKGWNPFISTNFKIRCGIGSNPIISTLSFWGRIDGSTKDFGS
jgi:hypothetical protein